MRRIVLLAALMLFMATPALAEEVNILIWSEYMPDEIPQQFEAKYGIKPKFTYFESIDELMAKLQHGALEQYDLIMSGDYIMPAMTAMDLLAELDHSKLPNLKNLKPAFLDPVFDPGNKHSVAYQWGFIGVLYNKTLVDASSQSWDLVLNPDTNAKQFALLDSGHEMLGLALCSLGEDANTTDVDVLKKAANKLIAAKKAKGFAGFEPGVGARNKISAGVVHAAVVYSGDALRAMADEPDTLAFFTPKEGSVAFVDCLSISAKAKNPDGAYKFINYILDPEVGAQLSNWTQFPTPNAASMEFITPEDSTNPAIYPPEELMGRLQFLRDLGKDNRIYDELWTVVKTR